MNRLFAVLLWLTLGVSAYAQTPSVARMGTTPTTTPEALKVLDKNNVWRPIGTFSSAGFTTGDIRADGAKCDGVTDDTAVINSVIASGRRVINIPVGCYIAGAVTLGQNQSFVGTYAWAGAQKQDNDYKSIANLILGPAATIVSGSGASLLATTTNSSVQNMVIVASNYAPSTTIRQAYTAARAFTGTALTCVTADFAIKNTLIIGFRTGVLATALNGQGQCSRLVMDQVQGDTTNGIVFQPDGAGDTSSADIPRLSNIEWFPFGTSAHNCNCGWESLSISNITNAGGLFEITLSSPPTEALQTGDIIQIGKTVGMPTLYDSTPGDGWPIHVIDSTHFTLDGSTFAGTYSVAPEAYFSAGWREGAGLSVTNAMTAIYVTNYFTQLYHTSIYLGANSGFLNCVNCWSEWQPGSVAPPTTIGWDIQNSNANKFVNGSPVAGIAIRMNTTDQWPQMFSNVGVAGMKYVIEIDAGHAQFSGGAPFPLNFSGYSTGIYLGTNGYACFRQENPVNVPILGNPSHAICNVIGETSGSSGADFGSTDNPGGATTVSVSNNGSGGYAQFQANSGSEKALYLRQEGNAGFIATESGDTNGLGLIAKSGDVLIQSNAGGITLAPFNGVVQIRNLPSSCVGLPSTALYNSGGALKVCP